MQAAKQLSMFSKGVIIPCRICVNMPSREAQYLIWQDHCHIMTTIAKVLTEIETVD